MMKVKLCNIIWDRRGKDVELPFILTVEVEETEDYTAAAIEKAEYEYGYTILSCFA